MKKLFVVFTLILLFAKVNVFASSEWKKPMMGFSGSKVRVIQSSFYDKNGKKSHIYALHFKVQDGWKLYGKDSKGLGISPSLDFAKSKKVKTHNIYWPKSETLTENIGSEVFNIDIYKNEVVIPFEIYGDIKDGDVLNFELVYGVCNKICVPVSNDFTIAVNKAIDEESFYLIKYYLKDFDIYLTKKGASDHELLAKNDKEIPMVTLCYALFAALIGGLILNIMPCVLPVLSIKLLSILKNHDFNVRTVRISFLSTVVGILFSFMTFGGVASSISYSGEVFNWGLQFQNPYFLTFLIAIFIVFMANILGYVNIGASGDLSNYVNKRVETSLAKRKIFAANFFSGILAVLLATPCSAPFLGAAISFSVTQAPIFIFMIFLFMGIGFSTPYLVLAVSPNLINIMPKSGSWTGLVKNILAGFILLTAIWLCYVLYHNVGSQIAITVTILSIMLFFSFKIKYKLIKTLVVFSLLLSIISAPSGFERKSLKNVSVKNESSKQEFTWSTFERVEISRHVKAGKTVIIDVTADWCLTCKFNKYRVFENEEVLGVLKGDNIIAMRADITKPNKVVMDFVNSYDRYAIPFNIVFGPNAKDGILLSELLNKEDFIKTIKKASK